MDEQLSPNNQQFTYNERCDLAVKATFRLYRKLGHKVTMDFVAGTMATYYQVDKDDVTSLADTQEA